MSKLSGEFCRKCSHPTSLVVIEDSEVQQCAKCGHTEWDPPVPVAVAIISGKKPGSIVLVQRGIEPRKGQWCMPAGFLNTGESPSVAAMREGKEESNLDIVVGELPVRIITPPGRNQNLNFFLAASSSGEMKPGSDALAVGEFTEGELPTIAFPAHVEVIGQFF
jgi:ADP-ribose pyrophosphatase YjhB (NUDIX family)